jgi:hypothetical protein
MQGLSGPMACEVALHSPTEFSFARSAPNISSISEQARDKCKIRNQQTVTESRPPTYACTKINQRRKKERLLLIMNAMNKTSQLERLRPH